MEPTTLKGKVVIVTGGSQGLGAAICHALAREGARVAICDIKVDQAEQVAKDVNENGGQAEVFHLDVSDEQSVKQTVSKMHETFGAIDILINNAGTDVTKSLEDLSVQEWDRVINVNLRGPFLMAKATYPYLANQKAGHIVNIASTAAKRTWTEASAYHASKWGLLGFSHSLHAEARKRGIKVTAIVAGGMRTAFILERFPDTDPILLQDPANVADTVRYVLTQPAETVIPELMVLPMKETSWP